MPKENINNIESIKSNMAQSCQLPFQMTLLMQYIDTDLTFKNYINKKGSGIVENELLQILFQIYAPLSVLNKTFTHYDLNDENVLLFKLRQNHYIIIEYVFDDKTIAFKTNYVAKIIDYGRSYFHLDDNINSTEVLKVMCNTEECNDKNNNKCGNDKGYHWYSCDKESKICPGKSDETVDLKLASQLTKSKIPYDIRNIINNINHNTDHSMNVLDFANTLKSNINKETFVSANNLCYQNQTFIGTLRVQMNKDENMTFSVSNEYAMNNKPPSRN
jgi:hypothetical protein